MSSDPSPDTLSTQTTITAARRVALAVVALNLGYFAVEFAVATVIQSASLFADSVDFLEDAMINGLVLVALGWSAHNRRRASRVLALLILVPACAAVWAVADKVLQPAIAVVPDAALLTLTGGGAFLVNCLAALLIARVRHAGGSLTRAAFLSARNDVISNVVVIAAGVATALTLSIWPDVIAAVIIIVLNADAALDVWRAADRDTDVRA